jgi:hypothetical protein
VGQAAGAVIPFIYTGTGHKLSDINLKTGTGNIRSEYSLLLKIPFEKDCHFRHQ